MYYPESWNPLTMLTSALAHGSWWHIAGNLLFFMAFAPALELLVGNRLRFIWIIIFICFVVGICYSISTLIEGSAPLPTLGLSGVVMGMMGLSIYLMSQARIKVLLWLVVFWKTLFVPAWILGVIYIGLDVWEMFTATDYHGINIVAHVSGGVAGYLYGFLWLKERREETKEELDEEIETMKVRQKFGKSREQAHRYKKITEQNQIVKEETREFDRFMGNVYQCVKTQRDSEAINELFARYDLSTPIPDLEALFKRVLEWGPSRTMLCLGRLIIHQLDSEKRYGRAIYYIEICQLVSPQFILADLSKTLFYARLAINADKLDIARNLVEESEKRYGNLVNADQCREFELQTVKEKVDIIL
ncbi:MAG: membrane associated rhomboid family serine protease [Gammaproteobacteria bacterium]|jgi:membrane associated rhomboid family serine protease